MKQLTEKQWLWLGIGAAVVGWIGVGWWSRTRQLRQPMFYLPGQEATVFQGQSIVLRLPAGGYQMIGGQDLVVLLSQVPRGVNTDVALQIGSAPNPFTVVPRFVDTRRPGTEYSLTITGVPVEAVTQ